MQRICSGGCIAAIGKTTRAGDDIARTARTPRCVVAGDPGWGRLCCDLLRLFLGSRLLLNLLSDDDRWGVLHFQDVWAQIGDLAKERFFMETGLTDHNALNDAPANRFAFNAAGKNSPVKSR